MSKPSENAVEGRAKLARPSLLLILTAAALWMTVPAAQAEQPEPVALTETDPLSSAGQPAASTTPSIIGRGDGAIISVIIPFGGRTRSPVSAAGTDPNNEVDIYANGTCAGTPVESGIVDELEGDGIQVEVAPDSTTIFSAIQIDPTDPTHPSVCSKPITYWHSSTAKEPPVEEPPASEPPPTKPPATTPPAADNRPAVAPPAPGLRTAPSGPANDNTPRVLGSAPNADSVKIFANSSCSGAPVAKVSPNELSAGVELHVADNSITSFAAISMAGTKQSPCSAPVAYTEDSTPPSTHITMGPGAKTRHRKAVFRFADTTEDPPGTIFLCRVNREKWAQCSSPFKLRHLHARSYVLRVKATDSAGNAETKGAKRRFKVIH